MWSCPSCDAAPGCRRCRVSGGVGGHCNAAPAGSNGVGVRLTHPQPQLAAMLAAEAVRVLVAQPGLARAWPLPAGVQWRGVGRRGAAWRYAVYLARGIKFTMSTRAGPGPGLHDHAAHPATHCQPQPGERREPRVGYALHDVASVRWVHLHPPPLSPTHSAAAVRAPPRPRPGARTSPITYT